MGHPLPYDDRPLLYGLLCFFSTVVLWGATWARQQPLPEWVSVGVVPDRIARVWVAPQLDGPSPDPDAEAPPAVPGSGIGVRPTAPSDPDAVTRAIAVLIGVDPEHPIDPGTIDLTDAEWADLLSATEDGRDSTAPPSLRPAGDTRALSDRSIGPVARLGNTEVEVARVRVAPPRVQAALRPLRAMPPRRVPPGDLARVLRERRRDMESCFSLARRRDPQASGRLVLSLQVEAGRVVQVDIKEDTVQSEHLRRCMTGRAKAWRFDEATTGTTGVPLAFAGR